METTHRSERQVVVVIPCSGDKLDHAAPARDLYTGRQFVRSLQAATSGSFGDSPTILVLSALHGLVELDEVVQPYEQKMGRKGSVTANTVALQAWQLGIDFTTATDVYALLPGAYYRVLDEALRKLDVYPADCYEACQLGVGEQRQVLRCAVQYSGQAVA